MTTLLGSVDLTHSSRVHSSRRNQRLRFCLVDLGLDNSGSLGCEPLEPKVFALCLLLTINPAVAKCDFERFGIRDRLLIGISLCQAKRRTGCPARVECKPRLPLGLIGKGEFYIALHFI